MCTGTRLHSVPSGITGPPRNPRGFGETGLVSSLLPFHPRFGHTSTAAVLARRLRTYYRHSMIYQVTSIHSSSSSSSGVVVQVYEYSRLDPIPPSCRISWFILRLQIGRPRQIFFNVKSENSPRPSNEPCVSCLCLACCMHGHQGQLCGYAAIESMGPR